MAQPSPHQWTTLSPHVQSVVDNLKPPHDAIAAVTAKYAHVKPRKPNTDGETESILNTTITHHFTYTHADDDRIKWHYITAGTSTGEAIVFLHGIPDSWYMFRHQITALAQKNYSCIAVDLKGYGQSEKGEGDYRHESVSEQLYTLLRQIGLTKWNLVTHDRGTVQADFMVAKHPENILRYARGEQHLYHFNPALAPQAIVFRDAARSGMMEDPVSFVCFVYTWVCNKELDEEEMERTIQEFAWEGTATAVPRYFHSSTFRQEWLARRDRLLDMWTCPVMLLQGKDSKTQPQEWYEGAERYLPNAKSVQVRLISGGHFWAVESPEETTAAIEELLKVEV